MKLYYLYSTASRQGGHVLMPDAKGRISQYITWNKADGKFLQFTVPRGDAGDGVSSKKLVSTDYLSASNGVPIFSEKARNLLVSVAADEVEFYECLISCKGQLHTFFLAKTLKYMPLVDMDRSTFEPLEGGGRIINEIQYSPAEGLNFYLARDKEFCGRLLASEKFVDLCHAEGLDIDFIDAN